MKRRENNARRERMIGVKVTDDEYEQIRVLAFEARKSLGAFLRDRALDSRKAKAAK
jgi:hypothetical protein